MRLLLGDELAPITSTIGFVEAAPDIVVSAFMEWEAAVMNPLGVHVSAKPVAGTLREALCRLLPLTAPRQRRYLFLPTDSRWLAYFDNGAEGGDAASICMHLARVLSCRTLRVTAIPHTITQARRAGGRYGACTLEVFGPGGDALGYTRAVSVVNDGGSWVFDQSGEPFPFERVANYLRRKITERFSFEDLRDYAGALGLRPFDEDFYHATEGRLVELTGKKPSGMVEMTLDQARAGF